MIILHDLTDEDEFVLNEIEKSPIHRRDLHLLYISIEEKIIIIENKFKKTEQNQHHLHIIDRFKEKILQKYSK